MALQTTSATKSYYDVLDGLRGTAAIVILVFHYLEMIYSDYSKSFLGHGFLAVDFFFCLSGFVIGFAYDGRIKTIGVKGFFANRLIRLHPLVIAGSVIGLAGFVFNPLVGDVGVGWDMLLLALAGSVLLLPTPFLPHRDGALFPYNSPSWSLFLEYIANIIYAFVLCRLKKIPLAALGFVVAGWLAYSAYSASSALPQLINGWDIKTYPDGFPRVGYSFMAGLLVFRFKAILNHKFGFFLPFALLMGVFLYPHIENDWLTEILLVIVIFPLIISIGAGAEVKGWVKRLCIFIGRLSYPLYMTHISTVWIFGNYYKQFHPEGIRLVIIVGSLCIFNLLFAYAVMRLYDEPVRLWLTAKWKNINKEDTIELNE
jgi:peptidoglycan/LPS O-acetylase OafA/YrhL